jgi:hypothetical protein
MAAARLVEFEDTRKDRVASWMISSLSSHDADLQNQRYLGLELWRSLYCATNDVQLEEEQDLFSSMRSSLQRTKCDWKKNKICSR